ncbi:MAG: ABC transporter ATP-binding protein [Candidatus Peribacteraceae bacterium]|nr:ABC transporter ATP-binding protein [Candidatus Peribacteraceae bacterium]
MDQKKASTIGKVLTLLKHIRISPWYLLIPVALSLLAAAFEGAGMGLLIPLLNGFLQKNFSFITDTPLLAPIVRQLPASVLANDRLLFGIFLGGFVIIFICKNIFRFLAVVSVAYFSERTLHHLRKTLFTKYLSFGKLFFDRTNIGHHHTLLLEFSQQALRPLQSIDGFITSLFSLLVYLGVMFTISWRLTLTALPLFFILHFAIRTMILQIKGLSRSLALRGRELGKKSVEILSTIPLVKSSRTEAQEQHFYTRISDDKARLDFRVRALQGLVLPLQEIITLLVALAIFVGSLLWFGREQIASAPALVVYFYIVINSSSKFGTLSGFRGTLAATVGPLDEVLAIFDERGKYFVRGGTRKFIGLEQAIAFHHLTFSYLEGRDVLHDVSFEVAKGKMTAIVGPTGAGKSTLIHLLMRYYDCPAGSILIDGTDIREFSTDSYLQRVALVSQDTLLLHESLRNNITYGLGNVPETELLDVVERARLTEFVGSLPQGLDTPIGDRGVQLSGGEKQRVSIARALLKKAEILILDEATSSLDSQTEKLIQEAITEAVQGRTSIVIAHRLSTIRHADTIVALQEGRVAEQGTLDQLLAKKGVFHMLWEEQRF